MPIVTRHYIEGVIQRVDDMLYGYSIKRRLTREEQQMRNKALIAMLYLSGRRISEIVGLEAYEGLTTNNIVVGKIGERQVLRFKVRILKKQSEVWRWKNLLMNDPFMKYLLAWLRYLKAKDYNGRVFAITRTRAWQIMVELDSHIWNHWFRHQRLSHLSDTMDEFELREFAEWSSLDPALDYIHRAPKRALDKVAEADEIWK